MADRARWRESSGNWSAHGTPALGFESQFFVETASDGTYSDFQVFVLDGCEISVTTLNGAPFSFTLGSGSLGTYDSGCIYGGGDNRFVTVFDEGSSRTTSEYSLTGSEWTFRTQTIAGAGAGTGEFALPGGFTTCLQG